MAAGRQKKSLSRVQQYKRRAMQRTQGRQLGRPHGAKASNADVIIAEGDSWFNFPPGIDLIYQLRGEHGYLIDNYAAPGDTLENMIYGCDIEANDRLALGISDEVLEAVKTYQPKVFLFSGGGNDVAGDEFVSYLNHADSGLPLFKEVYARYMINEVFKVHYQALIKKVFACSPKTQIVTHGYAYSVPSGKATKIAGLPLFGPWLRPAFACKRIQDETVRRQMVIKVIDMFNQLLKDLARAEPNFHYVDLRAVMQQDKDWADELHPKNAGFKKMAAQLHQKMQTLVEITTTPKRGRGTN